MFKIIALIVIIVLLAPIGYFAWRAGQPMSLPEYDGRTYYELLTERRQAYADLALEYQADHPDVNVKTKMCFQNESFCPSAIHFHGQGSAHWQK